MAGAASLGGTTTTKSRKMLAEQTTAFFQAMANSGLPIMTANLTEMRPTHNATFAQQLNNVLAPRVIGEATTPAAPPGPKNIIIIVLTAFAVVLVSVILVGGRLSPPLPCGSKL
jgi:hypothetical protein